MHIALARALLPSREVMHCAAWLREIVRIYGRCLRRNERARRRPPPGLPGALPLAEGDASGRPGISPSGGGTAVPPDRHHLRRLWRRRSPGTADPLRRDPADHVGEGMDHAGKGPEAAGPRAQHVPARHLSRPRHPARQHHSRRPDLPEPGIPARDERPERAARRLRAHRRDRHRPGRRRQFHRAGGQCADALGRVLHAGKPRNHDAAVSGPVRPPPRRTRGALSGRIAVGVALGGAALGLGGADGRADDARRLQFRLLRALLPGRQTGDRTGRGPRPHRQERRGVHAHHRGAEARRRDLPPRRRRFPRPPDLPPGFGARACPG